MNKNQKIIDNIDEFLSNQLNIYIKEINRENFIIKKLTSRENKIYEFYIQEIESQ